MAASKEDAIRYITRFAGSKQINNEVKTSIEVLQNASSNEGLSENDMDHLVNFLVTTKLSSNLINSLLVCLVPETKITKKNFEEILLWFFTAWGSNKIPFTVGKKFFQWLTGIVFYDLADLAVIDSYYYSLLFLLDVPHLERPVCKLLCLISKPEDAKRWVVQQILNIRKKQGPKSSTNALLSLLKSYRPEVVPERVAVTNICYENTGSFDELLKKAHSRNLSIMSKGDNYPKTYNLWNSWMLFDDKTMSRLIPAPEIFNLENDLIQKNKKLSILDFKTVTSVGIHQLQIEYPAQSLSLLANTAGHHLLAFSDPVMKCRFSHRLYHTLCKAFLLQLISYSDKEKSNFLNAIKKFQDYTNQGIPVVTTFLFHYLLIWDGEIYQKEVLGLLEWIEISTEQDLQKYVFLPLRQIFISSGTHVKCLIIETMGKLIRNVLIMDKRENNCFQSEHQEYDVTKSIVAIATFVSELISNALIWNNEKKSRNILMTAIDFYEITQAVEQAGDLPSIIIPPASIIYKCLFSGSRICIARICGVLTRLQENSVERLFLLGVYQDYAKEVQQLNIYMLDFYRYLWAHVEFLMGEDSFIFQDDIFREILQKLNKIHGENIDNFFQIEYNSAFWIPQAVGKREDLLKSVAEDYPSILRLKQIVEERLLQS